uniref:Uncharacterized protein n=1 Tax=Anopheles atroparvus TaxID=41427 RepID=A0AAG5DQV8_ANOAO
MTVRTEKFSVFPKARELLNQGPKSLQDTPMSQTPCQGLLKISGRRSFNEDKEKYLLYLSNAEKLSSSWKAIQTTAVRQDAVGNGIFLGKWRRNLRRNKSETGNLKT